MFMFMRLSLIEYVENIRLRKEIFLDELSLKRKYKELFSFIEKTQLQKFMKFVGKLV